MGGVRKERVAEELREVVARLLQGRVHDPRLGEVTITGVDITPNLRNVKIYYSCLQDDAKTMSEIEQGFAAALGFIRKQVGAALRLKYTPELSFHFDRSLAAGGKIDELLRRLKSDQEEDEQRGGA